MKKLILLFLISLNARGEDLSLKYGLGIAGSAKDSPSEVKVFSLTLQRPLIGNHLIDQYELGFFSDSRQDLGRQHSAFGFYSVGLNVDVGYFYAQSLWGVGAITTPDAYLGGNFQFTQDLSAGIKDSSGYSIGLDYKHISSAGLELPNKGRDFMMIRLSLPF